MADQKERFSFFTAASLTPDVVDEVHRAFKYAPWDNDQIERGSFVRLALEGAVQAIIQHVPPCATRTIAIRKILEARMDCNSAITFRGAF